VTYNLKRRVYSQLHKCQHCRYCRVVEKVVVEMEVIIVGLHLTVRIE
jgi:hypothetical protein